MLGPEGWTTFGPLPVERGSARGWIVFDPVTCAVEVGAVDLDGGPGAEDLQVARRWDGAAWSWTADWRVDGTRLARPGRATVPVDDLAIRVESRDGRVVRWREEEVSTEVLWDADGAFVGVARPGVTLKRTPKGVEADDGRNAVYTYDDGGRLIDVVDEWGVRTRYGWEEGRLATITWADGARVRVLDGQIDGSTGRWSCTRDGARSRIVGPGGVAWTVDSSPTETVVTDATGVVVRAWFEDGRLAGWDDPYGGRTRRVVDRDVVSLRDPTGATWRLEGAPWTAWSFPDGGTWRAARDDSGWIQSVTDALGRRATFERDEVGRVTRHGWGGAGVRFDRDRQGRIVSVQPATGGQIRIGRDGTGRVVRVLDGAGAAWSIPRDDGGRVRSIADPAGVTWELTRDALGRLTTVKEPSGRVVTVGRRDDDRLTSIRVGVQERWDLLRGPSGALTGVRGPDGRVWGWARDEADRIRSVMRPDQSAVGLSRDRAGEIVSASGVRVLRDAVGRPIGLTAGEAGLVWSRDVVGDVVGVEGPGVHLGLARDGTGRVRELRVAEQAVVQLQRDAAARVTAARGGIDVGIDRDTSGRIVALRRTGQPVMLIDRDLRGLVSALRIGEARWRLGRDSGGRVVDAEAPAGLRLGVDRDPAGEPRVVRIADGSLAEIARSDEAVDIVVRDGGDVVEGGAAWTWDVRGAIATLRSAAAWTFRRDPLGALVAMEGGGRAWSRVPDRIDGPDGAWIKMDINGAPREGRSPEGVPIWGVGAGKLAWVMGEEGELREVAGAQGSVRLVHDGVGRILGWSGVQTVRARWDALGRLASWDNAATDGWEALYAWGTQLRMPVMDAAVARPGGAVILGPFGSPVTTIHAGGLELSPGGLVLGPAAGETAVGGRFAPVPGAGLVGGTDLIDPFTGRATAGRLELPWSPAPWEAGAGVSPWADPDGAAPQWWDPAGFAPAGPWSDPMRVLAGAGRAPSGEVIGEAPGVGWLPASMAARWPAGIPDPRVWPMEAEPEVRWVMEVIRTGRPPRSEDFARAMFAAELAEEVRSLPGLEPALPNGFR